MATVDSARTLLETFEAYEEKDFDRLAELYAEDVTWDGTEPGPRIVGTARTCSACFAHAWAVAAKPPFIRSSASGREFSSSVTWKEIAS